MQVDGIKCQGSGSSNSNHTNQSQKNPKCPYFHIIPHICWIPIDRLIRRIKINEIMITAINMPMMERTLYFFRFWGSLLFRLFMRNITVKGMEINGSRSSCEMNTATMVDGTSDVA